MSLESRSAVRSVLNKKLVDADHPSKAAAVAGQVLKNAEQEQEEETEEVEILEGARRSVGQL